MNGGLLKGLTSLAAVGMLVATLCGCGASLRGPVASVTRQDADAVLFDANGVRRGVATLTQAQAGLILDLEAHGLPPGRRGAHLHAVGMCSAPTFSSAGSHWNPTGRHHGADNPAGPHKGDLPNLEVSVAGVATLHLVVQDGRLSDGAFPLLDQDGASIVIHAGEDDLRSEPAGDSGSRIICGVIHRR